MKFLGMGVDDSSICTDVRRPISGSLTSSISPVPSNDVRSGVNCTIAEEAEGSGKIGKISIAKAQFRYSPARTGRKKKPRSISPLQRLAKAGSKS